ncbi:SAVED domain-containing protein [Escherichia coli]|uniref:SAVED domain-containing protein n=1 Tax=Enterobacteriaceae TaxID=543 RepID=UPI0013D6D77C|nr:MULTISPECIES: SAVED domain-containing protein [Enterobacteriaceae]MBG0623495.1 SAVED domain-containing protein [Enterobacter roggenkampii]HCJ8641648.1 SAVED domain-containing protein [Escherichia coli]MBW9402337.1 SAVED domain-containing protein [Leclercia sp. EC_58]MCD9721024.1 SAVED domain-containing protein [Klebsiella pneumoniae]MCX2318227.1 SAVED domain-containing protein [Klebsiella quasipneumoniae]
MIFFQKCIYMLINWFTRQRKPPFIFLATGLAILKLGGGLSWQVILSYKDYGVKASSPEGSFITEILVPLLGIVLCIIGAVWAVCSAITDWRQNSKKSILVIRGEGLRRVAGSNIDSQIYKRHSGRLNYLDVNITQNIRDGYVIHPADVFRNYVQPLSRNLNQYFGATALNDIQVVYAGMLPVPFLFWIGNVLDDKGVVTLIDWNRASETWQVISDNTPDDGDSFNQETIMEGNVEDVVIAISFSYHADLTCIKKSFTGLRIEHLYLKHINFDNHWSIEKQQRLSLQFIEFVKKLQQQGAKRIHLILVAPSSVVVSFGRRYDSRNLPELIVYQYEKSDDDTYPWGVYAISHGREEGGFVLRTEALKVRF